MNIKSQSHARPKSYPMWSIKKNTTWAFLFILLYRIVLDLSYYFVISQVWNYAKFELHLNSIKLVESYFLLLIIFILMPKSLKKPSNVMLWLLILLSYIPMLTLFALKDEARIFMYAVTGFWMTVFLLYRSMLIPRLFLPSLKESKIIRYLIFISLSVTVFLIIYKYFGLLFNFDITKVYDIRAQFVGLKIPLAGYLFVWVAHITNPVFFMLFITKRKWFPAVLIIIFQILLFSVTGNRTFLFVLLFVLTLTWIITHKKSLAYIAIGLVSIILLGMLSYCLIEDIWISSLFTRRTLLVPAQLSFFYYDFFLNNNYTLFSQHRIFRIFLDYPYHVDPPHLIGEVYFGKPKMHANTGIVGDAYTNFGFVGLFLWSILLVVILKLIDTCSEGKDIRIVCAAIAMPTITLINSPLLTTLLTHGLLLALLFLYLLPKKRIASV